MKDLIDEIIEKAGANLMHQKELLIKERLIQIAGDEVDLVAESKRMFPRIKSVYFQSNRSEIYYWNDGSENGIEIITFYPLDSNIEYGNRSVLLGFKWK